MGKAFGNINRVIKTEKSLNEIDKSIQEYIAKSNQVKKWRFDNYTYDIKSKDRVWYMSPALPNFTIFIDLKEQNRFTHINVKISGNFLLDLFTITGILLAITSLLSIPILFDKAPAFGILNTLGILGSSYFLNWINRNYRKKGELEFLRMEQAIK